jgi:glucose uptake protein GlcU
MTSIPILFIQDYPPIHAFALLGGFLWCTGNLLCPIAIRFIGVGLGLILWGCSSMILGWATGKFGLFGLHKQDIGDPVLNYVGMCLAIVGLFVFVQVKTRDTSLDSRSYRIMKNYIHHNNNNRTSNHLYSHHHPHNNNQTITNTIHNTTTTTRKDHITITEPMLIDIKNRDVCISIDADTNSHPPPYHRHRHDDDNDSDDTNDDGGDPHDGVEGGADEEVHASNRFESSVYEDSVTTGTIDSNSRENHYLYGIKHSSSSNSRGNKNTTTTSNNNTNNNNKVTISFGDDWSEETKRIVGVICALSAGLFFGTSFDPSQYIIDHDYNGHDDTLNYVFSQYLGILLTSWTYTVLYCIYCYYHDVHPYITSEIFIPATASGIIWGIAETCYFLANGKLGFPITFPIISSGPGLIGSLWGVFVYQEIHGLDNLRMLALAFSITIPALILVGVSH